MDAPLNVGDTLPQCHFDEYLSCLSCWLDCPRCWIFTKDDKIYWIYWLDVVGSGGRIYKYAIAELTKKMVYQINNNEIPVREPFVTQECWVMDIDIFNDIVLSIEISDVKEYFENVVFWSRREQ